MGEIADSLIDGTFDSISGEYLGEGPGYPRTIYKDHAPSTGSMARGVTKWLINNGISHDKHAPLMKEFLIEQQPQLNMNRYKTNRNMKVHISKFCFSKFTSWINKKKL